VFLLQLDAQQSEQTVVNMVEEENKGLKVELGGRIRWWPIAELVFYF
jgi:hypothetical protein